LEGDRPDITLRGIALKPFITCHDEVKPLSPAERTYLHNSIIGGGVYDAHKFEPVVKEIDKAIYLVNHFADKGYETTINIMAISKDRGPELDEALQQIEEESQANAVYIVDSFGALYQEPIEELVKRCKKYLKTKEVGFHGHNNQQLAFSNTIEAIIHDANYLDATVYGIGRAAGNCPLELLLGFLNNPKFDIRPVLDLIANEFIPLREKIEWGYIIPHAIAGMMNEHPRAAIALRNSDEKENYRKFYDSLTSSLQVE
jgi:4-hydroxy 2-oxovalerate aldolase